MFPTNFLNVMEGAMINQIHFTNYAHDSFAEIRRIMSELFKTNDLLTVIHYKKKNDNILYFPERFLKIGVCRISEIFTSNDLDVEKISFKNADDVPDGFQLMCNLSLSCNYDYIKWCIIREELHEFPPESEVDELTYVDCLLESKLPVEIGVMIAIVLGESKKFHVNYYGNKRHMDTKEVGPSFVRFLNDIVDDDKGYFPEISFD